VDKKLSNWIEDFIQLDRKLRKKSAQVQKMYPWIEKLSKWIESYPNLDKVLSNWIEDFIQKCKGYKNACSCALFFWSILDKSLSKWIKISIQWIESSIQKCYISKVG
jgi:hypothetical protein